MKAKFIYENIRFERGQNPKHVMNIGADPNRHEFDSMQQFVEWIYMVLPHILKVSPDKLHEKIDKLADESWQGGTLPSFLFNEICEWIEDREPYIIDGREKRDIAGYGRLSDDKSFPSIDGELWTHVLLRILKENNMISSNLKDQYPY